ncbi:MAG TPA: hypothetical protein VFQ44_22955 [Streptosporangiaceae bacterium]|nr:hypothetical protein [Streptosporangiaceae bacterium]
MTLSDSPQAEPGRSATPTAVKTRLPIKLPPVRFKRPGWLAKARRPGLHLPGWLGKRLRQRQRVPGRMGDLAGRGFGRLTTLPGIVVAAWLLTGLPLLFGGVFAPVPMVLISAPLATAIAVNVLQRVPSRWPAELPGQARERGWMPWFGLIGTVAIAGGFTAWQLVRDSPSVIATRPPGASYQAGYWIAQHGSLPIPASLAAFGGAHAGLHLSSAGFFQQGHSVIPAVTAGLPMLLAGGFWTTGIGGGAVIVPVLGGLAVLSFGGLVGRLAGRHWAPAGAVVLAVTAPQLYTSRDAFSETAVQVLLFGGLSMLADALLMRQQKPAEAEASAGSPARPKEDSAARTLRLASAVMAGSAAPGVPPSLNGAQEPDGAAAGARGAAADDVTAPMKAVGRTSWFRRTGWERLVAWVRRMSWRKLAAGIGAGITAERLLAVLGGICLGLTSLLSLGSLVYLLPVIAVAGVLLAARRTAGVAFCIGLFIGTGYGVAAGYLLARPLADTLAPTLEVIGLDAAGTALVATLVLVALGRPGIRRVTRKVVAKPPVRWLPGFGSFLVIVALAGLAARPYIQKVHRVLGHAEADFIAALQRTAGLKIDPTRLYSEDTLYWVIWYAGIATVLLGAFGAAILLRRTVQALLTWKDASGARLDWALPVTVMLGGMAAVLWQPFTVPDQPWASRRLVPVVIPGMILFATWAAAWLTRRAKERGAGPVTSGFVGAFCVGAMLLPAVTTSFGLGLTHSGVGGGLRPSAGGIAQHRVGAGEMTAVRGLCSAIGRSSSVVILDQRLAAGFTQVIRGMCGVPVAWMASGTSSAEVDAVLAAISKAGRHPVVLGAKPAEVAGFGGSPTLVLNLRTTQESHDLTQAAGAPLPAKYTVWMVSGTSGAVGI